MQSIRAKNAVNTSWLVIRNAQLSEVKRAEGGMKGDGLFEGGFGGRRRCWLSWVVSGW